MEGKNILNRQKTWAPCVTETRETFHFICVVHYVHGWTNKTASEQICPHFQFEVKRCPPPPLCTFCWELQARQRGICRESPPLHVSSQLCTSVSESVSLLTLLIWSGISMSASHGGTTATTTIRFGTFAAASPSTQQTSCAATCLLDLSECFSKTHCWSGNMFGMCGKHRPGVIPVSPVGPFLRGRWLR